MSVFSRKDSPWWWIYLEPIKRKERTAFRIGDTTQRRRDSKQLAEAVYYQRMNDLGAQLHQVPRKTEPTTFAAFATWYEQHVIPGHRGASREREILKVLKTTFGPYALTEITSALVMEWRTERLLQPGSRKKSIVSPNTVNRETDVLKAMLTAAVPRYLSASPIAKLKRLRGLRRETVILTPAQEARLLRALAPPDRALVICALDTLMRLSDVLYLRRDQDRKTYVVVIDPKTTPYKVPVSARLRVALDGLHKSGPFYFHHRLKAKEPRDQRGSVQKMLRFGCRKAVPPIPYGQHRGLTFHALRHTGATRLAEAGVSMRVIQELGGWRSLRQLERYAHPSDAAKRAAVNLIGQAS